MVQSALLFLVLACGHCLFLSQIHVTHILHLKYCRLYSLFSLQCIQVNSVQVFVWPSISLLVFYYHICYTICPFNKYFVDSCFASLLPAIWPTTTRAKVWHKVNFAEVELAWPPVTLLLFPAILVALDRPATAATRRAVTVTTTREELAEITRTCYEQQNWSKPHSIISIFQFGASQQQPYDCKIIANY